MKKFVLATVAVIAVMSLTLCLDAQPAGGGAGGGGGMGMGGGMGGMGGGGMMGGGMGMGTRGARGPVVRPDKAARVALIKDLEKQLTTLKAAVDKAPDKDTAVTAESDQATMDKATAERQAETDAITAIQTTLASLRGAAATGGRGMMGGGGASADVLSELRVLASAEKASKTVARLDALIKEAQTRTGARGTGRGQGQGRGGDAGAGRGAGRGGAGGF
ncbi:MAG: hypothetical protein JW787_02115 [Sedimentisphaerales bacterium]|nr:hypothetical protein [Sedimentisphaerales bacterium]